MGIFQCSANILVLSKKTVPGNKALCFYFAAVQLGYLLESNLRSLFIHWPDSQNVSSGKLLVGI